MITLLTTYIKLAEEWGFEPQHRRTATTGFQDQPLTIRVIPLQYREGERVLL